MKLSISKSELQDALSIIRHGTARRAAMPVLNGLLIHAADDRVEFRSTDLSIAVRYQTNALVEDPGAIVAPPIMETIVKGLPDAAVHLEVVGDQLQVTCGTTSYTLRTMPADEFPPAPEFSAAKSISLPQEVFATTANKIQRFHANDESRAILTGVLLSKEGSTLRMVATDSYRLAVIELVGQASGDEDFEVVIPANYLKALIALPKSDEQMTISLSENRLQVKYQNTVFVFPTIEGSFPPYRNIIPTESTTTVKLRRPEFVEAVRRVSVFSSLVAPLRLDISSDSQTSCVSTVNQEYGAAQEVLSNTVEGDNIQIRFNATYLMEGLTSFDTDELTVEFTTSSRPGLMKTDEGDFLYIIMPVHPND